MRRSLQLIWGATWLVGGSSWAAEPAIDFTRDIRPILSNACYRCHGPDADGRKGGTDGLRLDTAEGVLADLGGYAALVPGKPEESELFRRITASDDEVMPPMGAGKKLSEREVQLIAAWIRQGAKFSRHWSYVKPVRPTLPTVSNPNWVRNGIDRFVLARLDAEGLLPSEEADRYSLARRVALDLTGLPPSLEEVETFVHDPSPDAYEEFVDRMLAKDAFGEHWALLWLDLARYADSAGYADDPARKIWLYRDYVIKSFNANKPFDQFTLEQIAGDLLPNPGDEQLVATAFHRNTLTNNEGGTNDEEFRNVAVVDRVNTTMAVWMGTTIACAQCHTHKYDPITQEDYFRFFAFFNNTADADRGDESPLLSVYTPEQNERRQRLQRQIEGLSPVLNSVTPELASAEMQWDAGFPRTLAWKPQVPTHVTSKAQSQTTIHDDGIVNVAGGAKTDTYTIEIPAPAAFRAMRLNALSEASLPGGGPGQAAGNFVITRLSALVKPPEGHQQEGRFVRIELPGDKFLSLAEVEVFSGADNLARQGVASQSSTAYDGDAKRAIDGNTNGNYYEANSTTHTAPGSNPWWEVDLTNKRPVERIVVWNRTDGVGERLSNFRVLLLNEQRQPVWSTEVAPSPNPSTELTVTGLRTINFEKAIADYSQPNFDAAQVLANKDPKAKGWAVGGAIGQSHSLTLICSELIEPLPGSTLVVNIEQESSFANHTLGRFQLALTDEARVEEWARTPAVVVAALQIPAKERTADQKQAVTKYYLNIAPGLDATRQQLAAWEKELGEIKPETVPIMRELTENRRVTQVQHRGNFMDLGKTVTEGTPESLLPLKSDAPLTRLTLAKWLVDPENPLTARVIANRYWEQLFGIGLVASSEEFGSQGDLPSHPELLDWLACELSGAGHGPAESSIVPQQPWDLKAFLKTIVTSATYRQSSKVSPELVQRDPENRLLARGPRFRLSAETLRDQALFVSGLLSRKMYGPPVKPPQPNLGLSAAFGSSTDWQTSSGEDRFRRGIYTTWRRSNPYPSMAAFDAPNREVCTVRRVRTNTPLQALVTLNDPAYIEAAQALARRIISEGGPSPESRATYAFRQVLLRPPHENEIQRIVSLLEKSRDRFSANPDDARKIATDPLGGDVAASDLPELAAWTVVGNVLLNLDETVMKR